MYYSDTGEEGLHWVHNLSWLLYDESTTFGTETNDWKVLRIGADTYWFRNTGGGYDSPVGTTYGLVSTTNGGHEATLERGVTATFDSNGSLLALKEAFGNQLSMTYTDSFPSNLLARVEHSNGLGIDLQYTDGALVQVTLPSMNLYIAYAYDTNADLVAASRVLPGETFSDGYSYVSIANGRGMATHTNALGHVAEFSYETNSVGDYTSRGVSTWVGTNKFLEAEIAYSSEAAHSRSVVENRNGTDYISEYIYHPLFDKIEAILGPELASTGTVTFRNEVRFGFDEYGNRTSATEYDWETATWTKTEMEVDASHRVTNVGYAYYSAPTNFWAYTWDDDFNLVASVTDPEGRAVEFDYTNGLISVARLMVDTNTSYETTYGYTTNGLLASVTNANGHFVDYGYDAYGYLKEIDPQAGPTVTLSNNVLGHLVKFELPGWLGSGMSPPGGEADPRVITLEPDGLGRVKKITYPDALEETFAYDPMDNLVTNVDRGGRTTTYTHEPLGRLSSVSRYLIGDSSTQEVTVAFTYDQQFNTLAITDPLDRVVEAYELDDLGRAVSVTNVDGQVMSVDYGVADYVNSMTRFDGSEVLFLYGENGLLSSAVYDDDTLGFDYFRNDLLKAATNSSASITNSYNSVNRLTNVVSVAGLLTSEVSYAYFPAGQVSNMTSEAGTVSFGYDAAERVTNIVDSVAGTFAYSYNTNNGLVDMVEYPNDVTCALAYDVMDRVTDISWTGPSGTLHSLSYQYDSAGMITNRTEQSLAGTRNSVFTYDSLDRLTGETYSDVSGTVFDEVEYGHDLAGNRTNKTHNGVTVSFELGAGNRMTNWTAQVSTNAEAVMYVAGYSSEDIGTDPRYGEWTVNAEDAEVSGTNFWSTTIFTDLSQSTQTVIAAMGDLAGNVGRDTNTWTLTIITNAAYSFDDAGNVTEIAYNTDLLVRTLGWDSQYQLTAVSNGSTEVESYSYDPFGRRLTTTQGTNTVTHLYDGIHCIADLDSSGGLIRSYTYGPGIDNPLAMTVFGDETNTYYYLTDHLGSVLALTDEDGQLVESYEYDAFGRIKVFDEAFEEIPESAYGNRITFQGREYSGATGLYYFRARWYEPVTGRWLSKDPIGISGGLNQYVAFNNNPVMARDPFGLEGFWAAYGQSLRENALMDASHGARGLLMSPVNLAKGIYGAAQGVGDYLGRMSVDPGGTLQGTGQAIMELPNTVPAALGRWASDPYAIGSTMGEVGLACGATKLLRGAPRVTKEIKIRPTPGRDGALSRHIIERVDGRVNSVTHQVVRDGRVIHQHQTHIGKYGTQRRFPDAWVEYPEIP